jgi:hypothetical protein
MGAALAGLAVVQVIRGWVSAVNDFVQSTTTLGDELDKASKSIGISTDALQSWRHAAGLSGVDAEVFTQGMLALQRAMSAGADSASGPAAQAFRTLGVSIVGADGNLRDVSDVLEDMGDGLQGVGSSAERVALLSALMSEAGARLGPLFAEGSEGVARMRAELEELGGGASPEMIQASADLADALARLDLALLSIRSRIATQILPVYEFFAEALQDATAWLARNEQALAAFKIGLIVVAAAVGVIAAAILIILGPALLGLLAAMAPVVLAITALILVIEDLYIWMTGGESVIGTFVEALLSLAGINFQGVRVAWRTFMEEVREGYNSVAGALGLPTIAGPTVRDLSRTGPKVESPAETQARQEAPEAPGGFLRGLQEFTARTQARTGLQDARRLVRDRDRRSATSTRSVTQNTSFQITGADPEAIADSVRRVLDSTNRDAVEALGQ